MATLYFWLHTVRGKRQRTRYRLSEADATRLVEPVRVQEGALEVAPVGVAPAGTWASGLVRREDGAMVAPPRGS
jgi:hypothetical protein